METRKIMPRVHVRQPKNAAPVPTRVVQPRFNLINTNATLSDAFALGFKTIAKKVRQLLK